MNRLWGYISVIMAMVLFGLSNTFNKILLGNLEPIDLAALSYCIAAVFLFAVRYSPLKNRLLTLINTGHDVENFMTRKDYVILFVTAILGTVIAPLLYLNGLNRTTAVNASLLLIVEILFVILIGIFFLKEHVNKKDSFGFIFIIVGTVFLITNGQPENFSISLDLGSTLIIGAAFFWSIDTTLSKFLSYKGDIILITAIKSAIGGLLLLLISLSINLTISLRLENLPYLLFVSVFSIGAALILIYLSIRIIGATRTGSLFSLSALFGAVFAFLILKEPFTIMQLLFGLLMLSGVLIFYLNSEDS
ncbi:MAG TPA: DMT family transporter [Methanobacteriaceae archaeon]|nr:DMT family transporter [Methanobacteriaceae archaeon]